MFPPLTALWPLPRRPCRTPESARVFFARNFSSMGLTSYTAEINRPRLDREREEERELAERALLERKVCVWGGIFRSVWIFSAGRFSVLQPQMLLVHEGVGAALSC